MPNDGGFLLCVALGAAGLLVSDVADRTITGASPLHVLVALAVAFALGRAWGPPASPPADSEGEWF